MSETNILIQRVLEAKEDIDLADDLIKDYLPFIRTECAKFAKRELVMGRDDEISIGMLAFHEAIRTYSRLKGAFLKYAALIIKSRLIDFARKEKRHSGHLSLDAKIDEKGHRLSEVISDNTHPQEEMMRSSATKEEIIELNYTLSSFGVSLKDVVDNCPLQKRTYEKCLQVIKYAKDQKALLDELLDTKRLPIKELSQKTKVSAKTIERHRRYLVAMLVIYTNGYEIIRGHLAHMIRREKG